MEKRDSFGTKLGIVLVTAGSAVGLSNIWRFPYMAVDNGGAVFIVIYVLCVLLFGVPCMVSEFIIGRNGQSNTIKAFRKLGGKTPWPLIGYLGVLTGFLITGYIAVVSGWCLQYFWASLIGQLQGDQEYFKTYFDSMVSSPVKPVLWMCIVMGISYLIVGHGIRDGIEKISKLLMPCLFILLLAIVGASCTLPDVEKGIEFLFRPDLSKVTRDVFIAALEQSFYSLSIAMGCLCTYASYFFGYANLPKSATQIAVIDSLVAILAGLMMFPAAITAGVELDSGHSLLFITLPNVFQQAFAPIPMMGYGILLLFFALVSLAGLTSLISLHEVSTAFLSESLRISRRKATLLVTIPTGIIGICCSWSMGVFDVLVIYGKTLFDWYGFFTSQLFLPIVGFLTSIFIGWFAPHAIVRQEFTNFGELRSRGYVRLFHLYIFLVKYACPLAMLFILLHHFDLLK